ncbi:MAG: ribbon-helix-helix protein, CopG family [Microvirga sp.]
MTLRLNQQQLELLDRTIARGIGRDREDLIRLALREYAAKRGLGGEPGVARPLEPTK